MDLRTSNGYNDMIYRVRGALPSFAPKLPDEIAADSAKAEALCKKLYEKEEKKGWYFPIPQTPDFLYITNPAALKLWNVDEVLSAPGKEHFRNQVIAKAGFDLLA